MKHEIKFESTEKYLKKLDGSLAGKNFWLVMDNGEEYDRVRYQWRTEGLPEALRESIS